MNGDPVARTFGVLRMRSRDRQEPHRTASPLELFFDLVFVVAVAISSATLHHLQVDGHLWGGIGGYLAVFFAVWWAWLNFTWFATSFAVDDWLYRVTTIIQMAGALVVAAGAAPAMTEGNFTIVTTGYVITRLAMVAQWLRAAVSVPELRGTALRFAAGITIVQIAWVLRLLLPPELGVASFLALVVAEISIPLIAERGNPTPWHAHHITERYGLFTIILLGESILASSNAVIDALQHGEHIPELIGLAIAGLILAAGMWWVYFSRDQSGHITTLSSSLTFGYFHYVIFAAAGAFSAGIEVMITVTEDPNVLTVPGLTATIPVAGFVLGIWLLTLRKTLTTTVNMIVLAAIVIIAAAGLLGSGGLGVASVAMIGIVIALEASATPAHRSSVSSKT